MTLATVNRLQTEIEFALHLGMEQVTISELDARLAALGYVRDPSTRSSSMARNLTTGNIYPNVHFGVKEIDTGLSAYNYKARRDNRFETLQAIRKTVFCVSHDAWFGV